MTVIKTLVLLALLLTEGAMAQSPQHLPTVELRAGMHRVVAQVAQTQDQRAMGLMHVKQMSTHEGMLFVFDEAATQCFWMRNTVLPLSIAFLAEDGSIVNMADMQPLDETSHCSSKPVRFALELNQGWFAKRGLKAGSKLQGAPFR